jgi:hypothetical protein
VSLACDQVRKLAAPDLGKEVIETLGMLLPTPTLWHASRGKSAAGSSRQGTVRYNSRALSLWHASRGKSAAGSSRQGTVRYNSRALSGFLSGIGMMTRLAISGTSPKIRTRADCAQGFTWSPAQDVRDRQQVPAQITSAVVNAVLVAPQFVVDAADSSAGKF